MKLNTGIFFWFSKNNNNNKKKNNNNNNKDNLHEKLELVSILGEMNKKNPPEKLLTNFNITQGLRESEGRLKFRAEKGEALVLGEDGIFLLLPEHGLDSLSDKGV
jgi:hypothetical protein